MVIYKTTNLIDGKFYIGKDSKDNPNYLGSGILITHAIKKYGRENFKKEILERCSTTEELNIAEIKWIKNLNATESYNIALGGDGGDTLSNHPNLDSIKNKLKGRVSCWKGKKRPDIVGDLNPSFRPEIRAKISAAKKGVKRLDIIGELNPSYREDVRQKISLKLKGIPKPKIKCPYCEVHGYKPNMNRWHFDNCKLKNND